MDKRMEDLYALPPQELYLLELVEQSGRLEEQMLAFAENLPMEQRMIIEAYVEIRNELEFQSVKRALKFANQKADS